jgi:hypothetical protein
VRRRAKIVQWRVIMTRMLALFSLLALAACEQSVAPAPRLQRPSIQQAASSGFDDVVKDNLKIEIAGTIDSPCTGETISFDGSSHIVMTLDETSNGATLSYHFNTQGVSGVGLATGTEYQVVQVQNQDETAVFIPANDSASVAVHERIISNGSADNFLADIVYMFTFPPFNATYKFRNVRCEG